MQQSTIENQLLAHLSASDFRILLPDLEWVDLAAGENLYKPNQDWEHAYFPTSGIVSVIAVTASGARGETGIVGREGFVGSAVILFADSAPFEILVQVQGRALRIKKGELQRAILKSPTLLAALLKFVHVFNVQVAQTAVVNVRYAVTQRLARWLAMYRDRVGINDFTMTHDFLSDMLGVRRAGVTEAVNKLEGRKIIKASRGKISILKPAQLIDVANGSYGIPESEYKRLIKKPRRRVEEGEELN